MERMRTSSAGNKGREGQDSVVLGLSSNADVLISSVMGVDFLENVYGREHRVFKGESDRFTNFFDWPDLNRILESHNLRTPQLRLFRGGVQLPESSYMQSDMGRRGRVRALIDPQRLFSALADGHTLALRYVDEIHPPLARLASAFECMLHSEFEFNLYASWTATEGFGAHWDDHDVFVHQLSGRKRWRIYGRNEYSLRPRESAMGNEPAEILDEFVLSAGDVLYLPRGFWHAPVTVEGAPSLHLTGSIPSTTGADLARWILGEMTFDEGMCAELPRFGSSDEQEHVLQSVQQGIVAALDRPDVLARFFAARDAKQRGRIRLVLPDVDGSM